MFDFNQCFRVYSLMLEAGSLTKAFRLLHTTNISS